MRSDNDDLCGWGLPLKTLLLGQNRRFEGRCPNDRYLICKRTLAKDTMNDRSWPKAAVALKPSRMSELGQQRTSSAIAIYVRFRGLSRHPRSAS